MSIEQLLGAGGGVLVLILTIVQITPIKINPWSFLARSIGNAINHDIKTEISEIKTSVSNIKETLDEREAVTARIRILRFNDELLSDVPHSKDYYDQILSDIDTYESYCDIHKDFKNNMTVFAVENIKKCYQNCMTKHNFL